MRGRALSLSLFFDALAGDGSNMRSFVFCEDVAEAFDTILHKGVVGETYNIGTKASLVPLVVEKCPHFLFGPV